MFSGRGNPIWAEYTAFEVMGASDWVWHEGGPSWGQSPELSCQGLILANETWGHSFSGRGYPIGVEYTVDKRAQLCAYIFAILFEFSGILIDFSD